MSLNVQRNSTTFSCSFRMGAIFTKNHTGVPAAEEQGHTYSIQQQHLPSLTSTFTVCTMTLKYVVWKKKKKKDSWSFCGPISWSLFWAAFELTAILLTQAVNTFAWQQRESSQLQIRRDGFFFLLTVLLVHENLERVHLVILKRESHFLRGVLVCELAVHEAVKTKRVFNI